MMVFGIFIVSIFTTTFIGRNEEFADLQMGAATGAERFGTVGGSMYSLFELMTLEGWQFVARPLVSASPGMAIFLFAFILTFTFGMLNMIVAMVVEKTIEQARRVEEEDEFELQELVQQNFLKLRQCFDTIDGDDVGSSGVITRQELTDALTINEEMTTILGDLGIPT